MLKFKISVPIYKTDIWCYVGCDHAAYIAAVGRLGGKTENDPCAVGAADNVRYGLCALWLKEFAWRVSEQVYAAHEISHITDFIFNNCGIIDPDTETRAYLHEYIYLQMWGKLKKLYNTRKNAN